ncbi:MAG: hypothetical protein DMD67_08600 [Gemmatimonadetes bacterium]|nr:MAG: hypothetical protein DMD67_08600 [Gemmatimonadota bacterium]
MQPPRPRPETTSSAPSRTAASTASSSRTTIRIARSPSTPTWPRASSTVGRPELIAGLARVKNYVDTGAFLAVQAAGAAVLPLAEELARGYVERFKERRDGMLPVLRSQGFEPETPAATMYVWVPLPDGVESAAFARRALTEAGVVTLPGSGFGAGGEGFFRIALTVGTPRLVEAAERLGKVLTAV